jgi:hypothetical protein
MWGDFLESARAAGKLSDERWRRYAEQALTLAIPPGALTVSGPPSDDGATLPVVVTYPPTRKAALRVKPLFLQTTVQAVDGDLLVAKQYKSQVEHPLQWAGGNYPQPYRVALDPEKVRSAAPGTHTVRMRVQAIVSEIPDFFLHQEREPGKYHPLLEKTYEFDGKFNPAPATAPSPSPPVSSRPALAR